MEGFNRVKENLPMYGFSSVINSQIQTIKELLENSLDAIKISTTEASNISITIRKHANIKDWIVISVSDNGCGISDPKDAVQCFCSTKALEANDHTNTKLMGKFGLGLFCVLLYSFNHTKEPVRMVTKTSEMSSTIIADFSGKLS